MGSGGKFKESRENLSTSIGKLACFDLKRLVLPFTILLLVSFKSYPCL